MSTVRAVHVASESRHPRKRLAFAAVVVALAGVLPMGVAQGAEPNRQPRATTQTTTTSADLAAVERIETVVAAALAYLGTPYRLGSEGPDTIDCSGLVFRAFSNGAELGQVGGARMRAVGYLRWFAARNLLTTDPAQVERGDLVIYGNGGHIGIYLGDGRVISAVTSGVSVHALDGLSVPATGFLAVDWTGERGPFRPGNVVLPTILNTPEAPASLVPAVAWTPEAPAADVAYGPAIAGEERLDMRTANSRTLESANGRFTTEVFSRPIHFLPVGSAEWQPIELRFHEPAEGDDLAALADMSPVTVTLRDPGAGSDLLALGSGELTVSLAPSSLGRNAAAPELGDDGRYADYRDLLGPGMGLRAYPRADGFKAFVVLSEEPRTRTFAFALTAPGLTIVNELDGSVTLRDAADAVVGRIPRPMLLDSSDIEGDGGGVRPEAVSFRADPGVDGSAQLTLTIERAALDEAVYPAFIDLGMVDFPTNAAAAGHTFASSAHPDSNFSAYQRPESPGYAELWHGRRPDRRDDNTAYLRFPGVAQLMRGGAIESASLAAFPYWQTDDATASETWLARITEEWDARALTWNARPATDVETATFETTKGYWSAMDVTRYVQEVVAGTMLDYGLVLHADAAGRGHWKRFVAESSVGAGSLEPRLVVNWSGLRPTAASVTHVLGPKATIAWSHAAVAPTPTRIQLEVSQDDFESVLSLSHIRGIAAAGTSRALAAPGLAPGIYAWRVRAKYSDGGPWSAWSEAGSLVVADPKLLDYLHNEGPGRTVFL